MKHLFCFCFWIITPWLLYGQTEEPIEISYKRENNGTINFFALNKTNIPYQVTLNFKTLKNLKSSLSLPHYIIVYPSSEPVFVLEIKVINPKEAINFNFDYTYIMGDPTLFSDEEFAYSFPYAHGKKHKLAQGYLGKLTHQNSYSLDFNMNVGDTVHATRSGKVVEIVMNYDKGGPDPKLEPYANKVVIMHDDGTFGHYVHLRKNGSLVKRDEIVAQGQAIALSGNTGYSHGPHLHFMVVQPTRMNQKTIPTKFIQNDKLITPKEGNYYYSFHPDREEFEIESAENIDFQNLRNTTLKASIKNDLKITTEQIDDVVLVYVENGFSSSASGSISAELKNMNASDRLPYDFVVPAASKVFLFTLKPSDSSKAYSFSFSIKYRK